MIIVRYNYCRKIELLAYRKAKRGQKSPKGLVSWFETQGYVSLECSDLLGVNNYLYLFLFQSGTDLVCVV